MFVITCQTGQVHIIIMVISALCIILRGTEHQESQGVAKNEAPQLCQLCKPYTPNIF